MQSACRPDHLGQQVLLLCPAEHGQGKGRRLSLKSPIIFFDMFHQCQMPSIENVITYHGLQWLGKVCRMSHDRLPVRTLFGRISGHGPRGRPHKTWIEFTRDDLTRLSELQGVRGKHINWWVWCKDWTVWTMNIHGFKQTDNTCRTGSAQAGVH